MTLYEIDKAIEDAFYSAVDPDTGEIINDEALEALRSQPGRRALLAATKNMTEEQVQKMADWLNTFVNGGDSD